jgi:chlorite dismutase
MMGLNDIPGRTMEVDPSRSNLTTFAGGAEGIWHVERIQAIAGPPLQAVSRVAVQEGRRGPLAGRATWLLNGVTSEERYVNQAEHGALATLQPPLGRPEAVWAALIPIRKSADWWELTSDVRREIFEERSHHIATGLTYLPAIARRLYHCRELGEPFDFLTWFEYAPHDAAAFDELVDVLRKTEEWTYVEREIDIRLVRETV